MIGYKAFGKNLKCRDFQYEIGKTYEMEEKPIIYKKGFHFCKNPIDVFGYYEFKHSNRICKVEALGEIIQEGTQYVTNKIKILEEISIDEIEINPNNVGERNTGEYNSGDFNSGDHNSGNKNSGYYNSGDFNSGNKNSGHCNSGDYNSGDCNSGNRNTGYKNTGGYNTGHYNSGNKNSGYYNSGDYNTGDFNTDLPKIRFFNKESGLTRIEFMKYIDYDYEKLLDSIYNNNLTKEDWIHIRKLPNYDPKIFFECTGIKDPEK